MASDAEEDYAEEDGTTSLAQCELQKRGGIKSILQLLSKSKKQSIHENLILILSNCTFELTEACVEIVKHDGLEVIRNFLHSDSYGQEIILATTSIIANCAAAPGIDKGRVVDDLYTSGMLNEIVDLISHANLRIANEACLCLGNLAYEDSAIRDRVGSVSKFLPKLVKLVEALLAMEIEQAKKAGALRTLGVHDELKDENCEEELQLGVLLENAAGTMANFVDGSTDNVQILVTEKCIEPLLCFVEQTTTMVNSITASNAYEQDPDILVENGLANAQEAIMSVLVQCVEHSSVACEELSTTPVEQDRGVTVCILLLGDVRFSMQAQAVHMLAEMCNCGVKPATRDRACQSIRSQQGALLALSWMISHVSHDIQVSAKRCIEALLRYGGKSKRCIYLSFIVQGVVPVFHQLRGSDNHNVVAFATKILAEFSSALDLEFLEELMEMLKSTAEGSTQALEEDAALGGVAAAEAVEALKDAGSDAAGNIATAIVHLCFGADVSIRQEFLQSEKGLETVLRMLSKSETRGAALDFFYAVETILPHPNQNEIEETATAFDNYVEESVDTLSSIRISGKPVTCESFETRNSQNCDFCFKLGPKRKNLWAHRAVLLGNGSPYIKSMMGKVAREIAIDPPKSIANHVGQDDYVDAFETLLYYMYFPDSSNEYLNNKLIKRPNLPLVLIQLTIQHDVKLIRQQISLFLRQLLSEENAIQCFKAALKASVPIHEDDTHVPNAKAPIDMSIESLRNDCFSFILEAIMPILRGSAGAEDDITITFKSFISQVLA